MSKIHDALRRVQVSTATDMAPLREQSVSEATAWPAPENDDSAAAEWSLCARQVVIDSEALIAAELLEPAHSHPAVIAEYRPIKDALLRAANSAGRGNHAPGNLAAVSSAAAGEGKTFVSINLALHVAKDMAWSVVLVDSAFDHPRLTECFAASAEPGFTDWLSDPSMSFLDVVMPSDVAGLAFLPHGKSPDAPERTLTDPSVAKRLAHIAGQNPQTLFLFDTPAVLQTHVTKALADLAGQVLFVIRAGSTVQAEVTGALKSLRGTRPVNLVLNQLPTKRELDRN